MIKFIWQNGWYLVTGLLIVGKITGVVRLPWIVVLAPAIAYWVTIYYMIQHTLTVL